MLTFLPLNVDVETNAVLKKLASTHRALGELKGVMGTIPNQHILLETLILREARESSAIENIISTFDEIYQSGFISNHFASSAAKEVHHYAKALIEGFTLIQPNGLLTSNHILQIQQIVEQNNAGYRKLPGTKLLNDKTGEIVYVPPQDYETIVSFMKNLEQFINDDSVLNLDPLVKMAIIHHQFESIHPFYDGNGRTGRIINILYLVQKGLLHLPILYLSKYIIKHKADYYRLLQEVRHSNTWENWIIFMLNAVEETALETLTLVNRINSLMQEYKLLIRNEHTKLYSQDLLNNLFRYPYTKIEFIQHDLQVSRNTAIRYLEELVKSNILIKHKIGRDNYFENRALFRLLSGH